MEEKILILIKANEDSSKDAIKTVIQKGYKVDARDFFVNSLTQNELAELINKTDLPIADCVRTVDKMYKKIFGEEDLTQYDRNLLFENLVKYPRLINRPIVIAGSRACIGRPISKLEAFLDEIKK